MLNIFSRGTKPIAIMGDKKRSTVTFPSNEDWPMIVKVLSVNNTEAGQVIEAHKVYDVSQKPFYGWNISGFPVTIGQWVIFHRVGAFNSQGGPDPELNQEEPSNTSFLAFPMPSLLFIEDLGEQDGMRMGQAGDFDAAGTFSAASMPGQLPVEVLDPTTCYHQKPPYKQGRIYPGILAGQVYLVFLPGFGAKQSEETLELASGDKIIFDLDGSRKIIDVRGEMAEVSCPATDPFYKTAQYWFNLYSPASFPFAVDTPNVAKDPTQKWVYSVLARIDGSYVGHYDTTMNYTLMGWENYDGGTTFEDKVFSTSPGQAFYSGDQPIANYNSIFIEVPREFTPNKGSFFNGQIDHYADPSNVYIQVCDHDKIRSSTPNNYTTVKSHPKWTLSLSEVIPVYDPASDQAFGGGDPMPSIPFAACRSAPGSGWNDDASDFLLFVSQTANIFQPANGNLVPGWSDLLTAGEFSTKHIGNYLAASGIVGVINSANFGPILVFRREREHHFSWDTPSMSFVDGTNFANSGGGYSRGADRWLSPRANVGQIFSGGFPYAN